MTQFAANPRPKAGDRVRHILGESLACFAEHGFERVTYDDLIARSKVSRGSFYWYFPSKEALYDAVLDYCVTGYVARLEAEFAQHQSARSHRQAPARRVPGAISTRTARNTACCCARRRREARSRSSRTGTTTATAFMRRKLEPYVKSGKLDRATAEVLPDVLGAFIDGVCVRLVLDDEGSVSKLKKNIETFLCRIVG